MVFCYAGLTNIPWSTYR